MRHDRLTFFSLKVLVSQRSFQKWADTKNIYFILQAAPAFPAYPPVLGFMLHTMGRGRINYVNHSTIFSIKEKRRHIFGAILKQHNTSTVPSFGNYNVFLLNRQDNVPSE